MFPLSNIVNYFRSCYQVDFKAITILNFFGNKVADQLILETAELLNGKLLQYPVDSVWGAEMEKNLALHSQEKALYCCAFFLSGKMNIIGKARKVFTPLYIYPVDLLVEHEVYYLELDVENVVINPVFIDFIRSQPGGADLTYDALAEALPKGHIQFDEMHQIETVLSQLIPNLDISKLDDFPDLMNREELEKISKKRNVGTKLSLLPAIGVGLIQKPTGSRGILNELEKMADDDDFSAIISDLFTDSKQLINQGKAQPILSPVTLNESQEGVLDSCDKHRISMVVGPPGTGKSFTTAALAINLISQGKSVLIASKNNQAGNVIAHKIEKDFGLKNITIRTSKRGYLNTLQRRLDDILHNYSGRTKEFSEIKKLRVALQKLEKEIIQRENILRSRTADEVEWGQFFHDFQGSFFQQFKKSLITYRVNSRIGFWTLTKGLDTLVARLEKATKLLIRANFDYQLYSALRNDRIHLTKLLHALQSDTGNLMQEQFTKLNFRFILHALPIWTVNSMDVYQTLPLIKELFDVVIIDEATQCDIASSLPLLQRAKKAVIVGDPKQLRHISFLSKKQQSYFAKKHQIDEQLGHKINYRKSSLLDLVSAVIPSQEQVHFLNEHYRSMPDIIDFSNRHFYNSKLSIMTATPTTLKEKNVFLHQTNGTRNSKGQNETEIEAIIEKVRQLIDYEADLNKNLCQSIGILSPFRAQVTLLKNRIRKVTSARDMTRHQILIGTPFHFQGEERDVMLISFVLDDNSHPSSFIYLNRPDVFNVSITRARSLQHVFSSVSLDNLKPDRLFTNYIHEALKDPVSDSDISTYHEEDDFMEEVVSLLEKWNVDHIYKSYPIAGMEIDIVVVHEEKTFCIDLIGFPGDYVEAFPMNQWSMLGRIGVAAFSLPYSSWYINGKSTKKALQQFIFGRKGKKQQL
ncbi:MAG: hypothetical protein ACI9XB_002132 [Gammaproteobacteria bacterium]|jgi:hypothetical protein